MYFNSFKYILIYFNTPFYLPPFRTVCVRTYERTDGTYTLPVPSVHSQHPWADTESGEIRSTYLKNLFLLTSLSSSFSSSSPYPPPLMIIISCSSIPSLVILLLFILLHTSYSPLILLLPPRHPPPHLFLFLIVSQRHLTAHSGLISSAIFIDDGSKLITAGQTDGTIILWKVKHTHVLYEYRHVHMQSI